jgi:hypothetical protein
MREGFEEALSKYSFLVDQNRYWSLLQNYLEYYDREQVKILFYDDLRDRPKKFVGELCIAVGVDPTKVSSELLGEEVNSGAKARHWTLGRAASIAASVLRRTGNHAMLDRVKRSDFLRSLVLKPLSDKEKSVMKDETRQRLLAEYESEIRAIEQFTGRSLQGWRNI